MQHCSIPACYFPSMVLFLDDGHDFLLNVMLQLDERVAYRLFDVPIEALSFVHNYRRELRTFSRHCMSEYTEAKRYFNQRLNEDLAALYAEMYNPYRFSEIAVVVVDYHARGMDGLEFCRRIENCHIKKILLIQPQDEACALEALDNGLIDSYVCKTDPDIISLINQHIHVQQEAYFLNMSMMIARLLHMALPHSLYDQEFAALFHQLRKKHGIIEYYLIDHGGSFVMLDEDANASVLLVKHEKDVQLSYEFARQNAASEALLHALACGEQMLWMNIISPSDATKLKWSEWLVPSQRMMAQETYVYAYLPHDSLLTFRQKKVLSYHRYLDELDAEELVMS